MADVDDEALLFDPGSHEPVTGVAWDAGRARASIRAIAAETGRAFDPDRLWLPHPLDEAEDEPPLERPACVYLGAAGVIWALHALDRGGLVESGRDWAPVAAGLPERFRERPDMPVPGHDGIGPVPSLMVGEAGILLVAHALAPGRGQEERLLELVRLNAANPSLELFWGSPGTMLAAGVMHERTGDRAWADAWLDSADRLWDAWEGDLWTQGFGARPVHYLGPAHGFAGNVLALARGSLLEPGRRHELERRAAVVAALHAQRADGLAQWPPALEPSGPGQAIRTQWCHGAPGMVTSLAGLAPGDDELTELLLAGGELTWRAGPLRKGAGLCHGTAGNGYAFLKLFERTGDELWLQRARAFAMHALEQVGRTTAADGRGRHSLWTGDLGAALFAQSCLDASTAVPTLDGY